MKPDPDRELREEIESHLAMRARHSGIPLAEARRRFGNTTRVQEEMRAMHVNVWFETLLRDIRYAIRGFARAPMMTLTCVAAIAIGVGASTAVFSVVDRILFRSLPFTDEDRLVWLGMTAPLSSDEFVLSGDYFEWKERQKVFSRFTASTSAGDCDLTESNPVRLRCQSVDADYLDTFGIHLAAGRGFTSDETRIGGPGVIVISHAIWQSRFGGAMDAIGKTLQLSGRGFQVIGVLPKDFELPNLRPVDVLRPLAFDESLARSRKGAQFFLNCWARLKPGVSVEQARAAMEPLFQNSLQYVPKQFVKEVRLKISPLHERQARDSRLASLAMLAAVLCVLLISCGNVANMLLAKSAAAAHETAIRAAIGATRGRLIRQRLTESLLLAACGGLAAVALGQLLLRTAIHYAPPGIPRLADSTLDLRVLAFALALSLISGIFFGVFPSLERPSPELLTGARTTGSRRGLIRHTLVALQMALSLALLYCAVLLIESLWKMQSIPLGISTERLLSAEVFLNRMKYSQPARRQEFWEQLEQRLSRMPGLETYTISDSIPPMGRVQFMIFSRMRVDGRDEDLSRGTGGMVAWRHVLPSYFQTFRLQMIEGRPLTPADRAQDKPVTVVSQSLARRLFPGVSALGHTVRTGHDEVWREVVGVAADARNAGLSETDPEYYILMPRDVPSGGVITVRSSGNPQLITSLLRTEIHALDPGIPLSLETMEQRAGHLTERPQFNAIVLGFFALTGIALAGIGVHGVVSYLVAQRTREIGVRVAMGATSGQIRALVLRNVLVWSAFGCLGGLALLAIVVNWVRPLLFETDPRQPAAIALAVVTVVLAAVLSALAPARRASRLDPLAALRQD